jgi:mono/diheme cytochrome c family protein
MLVKYLYVPEALALRYDVPYQPVMPTTRSFLILVLGAAFCSAQENPAEFFEAKIRPILANNCYSCHTTSKLGGLRVDSRQALLQGGKSGASIVPGKPEASLLIRAVAQTDAKLKMPMTGPKLKDEQIADLSRWIKMGAPWPEEKQAAVRPKGFAITPEQRKFWSLQPIHKPEPPKVADPAWAHNAIDNFILAKLEEQGLTPAKLADRRKLIRRATYDLTGLPPTPEEIDAFVKDTSPDAFAKVVDRLLASPQYGERWARHWLDVARYADGDGGKDKRPVFIGYGTAKDAYANTWRYRDWVINAFNKDMSYDTFVKAQIAADLMPGKKDDLLPGLGFFGIGPWFTGDDVVFVEARANERDDKIDALTKGFLGLTVTCARCHDHKYDPISQKDYYALGGIFGSSGYWEYNIAPPDVVAKYQAHNKRIKDQEAAITEFMEQSTIDVAQSLAAQTARYMMAGRAVIQGKTPDPQGLDDDTLKRWVKYLREKERQHPYLKEWDALMARGGTDEEAKRLADQFQSLVLQVIADRKVTLAANREMIRDYKPDANEARASLPGDLMQFELFQFKQMLVQKVMETTKFYVWLDVVQGEPSSPDYPRKTAVLEYANEKLLRRFQPEQKAKLEAMQAELAELHKTLPPEYPYLMGLADDPKPANLKLNIRGNAHALGDEVPRGFPAILAGTDQPMPFTHGSGRLELAEAIVKHPLAARVMVNRIWMEHFGRGIVATPSNFGVMGERPSHPELLDYLASRFIESGWSMKAIHREIMLSAAYQLSFAYSEKNSAIDPDNKYLWRANLRRLDAEELRDTLLFASGTLDERTGGPPQDLNSANNKKRTIYGRIARGGPNRMLLLFDFPDPNITGDQRGITNVPLQGLFFMNSDLVWRQAGLFIKRLGNAESDEAKIKDAYRLLYGRDATQTEIQRGLRFLHQAGQDAWQQYAQALLSAGETTYIN